ncbi:unnamed protein product [Ilex paraguariensis]|uniref:cysteine dioxygenase n=1 Tax=Ilex paraguariensis TaxID=185542 RepID=A0ABC8RYR1_9AQUA
MCIFCFPTSSVIPLHDHPGMTVLSKVLYGSLHVKSYDWVEPACVKKTKGTGPSPVRLAKMAYDKVLTAPHDISVLYPKSGGNLHCFTALTPCAMLDILAPPYQEAAGRKCTYYLDYPYSSFSTSYGDDINEGKEEEYAWLAEIETPDSLDMRQGRYTGPAIQTCDSKNEVHYGGIFSGFCQAPVNGDPNKGSITERSQGGSATKENGSHRIRCSSAEKRQCVAIIINFCTWEKRIRVPSWLVEENEEPCHRTSLSSVQPKIIVNLHGVFFPNGIPLFGIETFFMRQKGRERLDDPLSGDTEAIQSFLLVGGVMVATCNGGGHLSEYMILSELPLKFLSFGREW